MGRFVEGATLSLCNKANTNARRVADDTFGAQRVWWKTALIRWWSKDQSKMCDLRVGWNQQVVGNGLFECDKKNMASPSKMSTSKHRIIISIYYFHASLLAWKAFIFEAEQGMTSPSVGN